VPVTDAVIAFRTDAGDAVRLRVAIDRPGRTASASDVDVPPRRASAWFEVRVAVGDVAGGDAVRITSLAGVWRNFHTWILRNAPRGK
jgi:hypothetical protein